MNHNTFNFNLNFLAIQFLFMLILIILILIYIIGHYFRLKLTFFILKHIKFLIFNNSLYSTNHLNINLTILTIIIII